MKPVMLLGVAVCMAAFAPAGAAAAETKSASTRDPNRMVCRTEPVVGSRLAKARRCMTAGEWAEMKRLDRQAIEKTQMRDERAN